MSDVVRQASVAIACIAYLSASGCGSGATAPGRAHLRSRAEPRGATAATARVDSRSTIASVRPCPSSDAAGVVERVNEVRRRARVPALRVDAQLTAAARVRARSLARAQGLSHAGWQRVLRVNGARGATLGENVASDYADADAVMAGWMESRRHRRNILNRSFRRIGVGCAIDAAGNRWWAQDFAD